MLSTQIVERGHGISLVFQSRPLQFFDKLDELKNGGNLTENEEKKFVGKYWMGEHWKKMDEMKSKNWKP